MLVRKRSILVAVLLLCLVLLVAGCGHRNRGQQQEEEQQQAAPTAAEETLQMAESLPDAYQMDVEQIYSGIEDQPGLCYLGAFAMAAQYCDSDFGFNDTVGYSGMGTTALCVDTPNLQAPHGLASKYGQESMINVMENLGGSTGFGVLEGGVDSDRFPSNLSFADTAEELIYFSDRDEALTYLKCVLASDHPAIVYLNLYYVHDDFADQSDAWQLMPKEHTAHLMTVTGYDADKIYLNDSTDITDAGKDLETGTENFMLAWENTGQIEEARPLGPFWMLWVKDLGTRQPVADIIDWNASVGGDGPEQIREFASEYETSDQVAMNLRELALARQYFADFLAEYGEEDAADLYRQSGDLLLRAAKDTGSPVDDLNQAADLEEEANNMLKQQ